MRDGSRSSRPDHEKHEQLIRAGRLDQLAVADLPQTRARLAAHHDAFGEDDRLDIQFEVRLVVCLRRID